MTLPKKHQEYVTDILKYIYIQVWFLCLIAYNLHGLFIVKAILVE